MDSESYQNAGSRDGVGGTVPGDSALDWLFTDEAQGTGAIRATMEAYKWAEAWPNSAHGGGGGGGGAGSGGGSGSSGAGDGRDGKGRAHDGAADQGGSSGGSGSGCGGTGGCGGGGGGGAAAANDPRGAAPRTGLQRDRAPDPDSEESEEVDYECEE